jgi:hypothetical protein
MFFLRTVQGNEVRADEAAPVVDAKSNFSHDVLSARRRPNSDQMESAGWRAKLSHDLTVATRERRQFYSDCPKNRRSRLSMDSAKRS